MDNGPEFTGPVRLVGTDGVGLRFIQPGKPIQNAFVGTVHSAISRRNGSRAGSARPELDEGPRPRPALAPASGWFRRVTSRRSACARSPAQWVRPCRASRGLG